MSEGSTPVVKVGLKRLPITEMVERDAMLGLCALLAGLPRDDRTALLEGGQLLRFPDGAHLFKQGDRKDSLLWLTRGEVRLVATQDGQAIELTVVQRGGVVGEAEALGGNARLWTAIAVGEADVLEIGRAALTALVQRHPATRRYLADLDAHRRDQARELAAFLGRW